MDYEEVVEEEDEEKEGGGGRGIWGSSSPEIGVRGNTARWITSKDGVIIVIITPENAIMATLLAEVGVPERPSRHARLSWNPSLISLKVFHRCRHRSLRPCAGLFFGTWGGVLRCDGEMEQ